MVACVFKTADHGRGGSYPLRELLLGETGLFPKLSTNGQTVHFWQHEIQNDSIWRIIQC